MASFEHGAATIHYDVEGEGYPILLIAPGGMRSANDLWSNAPWNPRVALAGEYELIGMDQRNAGRSTAPITPDDGWATYTADQLALLDHLGIDRCHVVGMCIGGPYVIGLLLAAPERFSAAVLLQPVGIEPDGSNRTAFEQMFDQWRHGHGDRLAGVDDAVWSAFRGNMWDGEFVLTASPSDVSRIATPMLVAMGDDQYHPQATSRTLAEHAPSAELIETWKQGDALSQFDVVARRFLRTHRP